MADKMTPAQQLLRGVGVVFIEGVVPSFLNAIKLVDASVTCWNAHTHTVRLRTCSFLALSCALPPLLDPKEYDSGRSAQHHFVSEGSFRE